MTDNSNSVDSELKDTALQASVLEIETQRNMMSTRCSQLASQAEQYKLLFEREKKKVIQLTEDLAKAKSDSLDKKEV